MTITIISQLLAQTDFSSCDISNYQEKHYKKLRHNIIDIMFNMLYYIYMSNMIYYIIINM